MVVAQKRNQPWNSLSIQATGWNYHCDIRRRPTANLMFAISLRVYLPDLSRTTLLHQSPLKRTVTERAYKPVRCCPSLIVSPIDWKKPQSVLGMYGIFPRNAAWRRWGVVEESRGIFDTRQMFGTFNELSR